MNNKEIGI